MAASTYDDLYDDLYGEEAAPPAKAAVAPAQSSSSGGQQNAAPAREVPSLPNNPMHFDMGANYRPNDRPVRPADMPDEGKMFIGGLNWDTTDDTLKSYFETFGVVTHCVIMRDQETRRSRGFAFLTFEDPASVNSVLSGQEHMLDGKLIDPKRAVPRGESAKTDKLFVRNIPSGCTQESFVAFFREFGRVGEITLVMDKETGRHRGFGFVNFEDPKAVEKILFSGPHMMDGQALEIKRAAARGEVGNRFNNQNQGGYNSNSSYNNNSSFNNRGNNGPPPRPASNQSNSNSTTDPNSFDPAMMAKMFQMMMAANPMMMGGMQGGMGGMGMGNMGNFGNMGGVPGMGFPNMMGMPYQNMMGSMGSPSGATGGDAVALDYDGGATSPSDGDGHSSRGAPSGSSRRRGGRFNPPTGPASMRDGSSESPGGAGPIRPQNSGSNYHPYAR